MADLKDLEKSLRTAIAFIKTKVPDIIGTESVNHFRESFQDEGFTDKSLSKWKDVKRRDPSSKWYGFSANRKSRRSEAATSRKILSGESKDLAESITYSKAPGHIIIESDKPYAEVHNDGGKAKIFGKKEFTMPARKFIGPSEDLDQKIDDKMTRELDKIFKH
jgi:phage virion morphogenesis protein